MQWKLIERGPKPGSQLVHVGWLEHGEVVARRALLDHVAVGVQAPVGDATSMYPVTGPPDGDRAVQHRRLVRAEQLFMHCRQLRLPFQRG
jgi:hypothetical protein